MKSDSAHLDAFQRRLEGGKPRVLRGLWQELCLALPRLIYYLVEMLLALVLTVCLAAPILILLLGRRLITGKPVFVRKTIYGRDAKALELNLFNLEAWLPRHAALFPCVMPGKLNLVGVSFRDYESHQHTAADSWLLGFKPGIFNLHFIQSSVRLAGASQNQTDWDYLHHRRGLSDLVLLLFAIPALLYHQSADLQADSIDIFGIRMLNISMADAIALLDSKLQTKEKKSVFFVNPDCLNKVFVDRDYHRILKGNEVVFPDGIGITIASKMLGTPLRENLNGTDMLPHLCELAIARGYRIFLLGAGEGVAERMKEKLSARYAGLAICGVQHGFFDWDRDAVQVIERINESGADIVLIAFGAPLQEKFISRFASEIDASILMGVGGLFDFYSGRISRAPLWMRQIGIEWIYRLMQEPTRMWKRYIIGNPLFLFRVFRWKMNRSSL